MITESMEVPYDQQMMEESMGTEPNTSMYGQIIEESIEADKSMTAPTMTAEQRAAHANLMKEIKTTGGKKPSQVAAAKKKATKKTTTAKKPHKSYKNNNCKKSNYAKNN